MNLSIRDIVVRVLALHRRGRRRLGRVFNRSRLVRWLLTLPYEQPSQDVPGLVLIQVDGLARVQFERALKKRRMPFLHELLRVHGYTIHSHYSGLPSSTPAVQAEIMYGVECAVPAFDFHDVKTGAYRCMFETESASILEEALETQGQPLLAGGSAYCDIYTGGAEECHFCASRLGWNSIRSRTNPLRVFAILLLYFDAIVRIAGLILVESFLTLIDFIRGTLRGFRIKSELFMVPARVVVSIVMREWSTLGAEVDIIRGLPVVQINYLGYDEQSHRRGPSSHYAHWTLKGIDDSIRRLWVAAQRSSRRPYRVWIYSDHGQEYVLPYAVHAGRTLDEAVKDVLANLGITAYAPWHKRPLRSASRASWMRAKNRGWTVSEPNAARDESTSPEPTLTSKGPVAHLYIAEAMADPERDRIARALVEHAKIPAVVARQARDRAVAWTPEGRFDLPSQASRVVGEKHPFLQEVARDLVCLAQSPNAGTLLLLGWRADERPLSFPDEYGSHAGPGYHETHGFALLPADVPIPWQGRDFLRPIDLRNAALRARPPIPRPDADAGPVPVEIRKTAQI